MEDLLDSIRKCAVCADFLPYPPRPIVQASTNSKIVIIGQAPGQRVQDSGVPFFDKSGDQLRKWLGVDKEKFYDSSKFAILPMGFCYPGKGSTGDLPPRPECAPLWHHKVLERMANVKLTLLIGQYAQGYYLQDRAKETLTETVQAFDSYLPKYLPLVHPSPRNNIWKSKNKWFEAEVIPQLQTIVKNILSH